MKKKFIAVLIFVLLATALLPNFIYATDLDELEVNTQDFKTIQDSYSADSWAKFRDNAKADIKVEAGRKTKQVRETISFKAGIASAIGAWIMLPLTTVSGILTIVTRGEKNFLIKGDTITAWDKSKKADLGKVNGYSINWFTIEDAVFGKIGLFDTDYFLTDTSEDPTNKAIKESVALFYYITKVIAVVFGLLMLIYVGIRMAISTVASEIAKYKDMLKDWLVGMVLIFAMPYIIGFINMMAGGLTEIFASIPRAPGFEKSILWQSINLSNITSGWSYIATICMYIVITVYQIKFFLMYLYRMMAMGFLIVISPLISIMYSTKTKIRGKGGKSAAFDTWMKEYTVNAFLQPLHAAIYLVFIVSANEIFKVAPFLAVIFFAMLSRAERIVKNILGMRKRASINSMAAYLPIGKKK